VRCALRQSTLFNVGQDSSRFEGHKQYDDVQPHEQGPRHGYLATRSDCRRRVSEDATAATNCEHLGGTFAPREGRGVVMAARARLTQTELSQHISKRMPKNSAFDIDQDDSAIMRAALLEAGLEGLLARIDSFDLGGDDIKDVARLSKDRHYKEASAQR
jgi:hypothetical protein